MDNTAIPSSLGTTVTGALKTLSNGNGFVLNLLWTNPNMDAAFSAQTVTVATGYKMYYILAKYAYSASYSNEVTYPHSGCLLLAGHSAEMNCVGYTGSSTPYVGKRTFSCAAESNKIVISNATGSAWGSSETAHLIPRWIWGIK